MTDAQTEARAIARRLWKEHGGAQHGPHTETLTMPLDRFNGFVDALITTALAAKDAELAVARDSKARWRRTSEEQTARAERAETGERAAHDAANTAIRQRDEARAQLAEARKALERHRSERSYVVGWNDGFAHATSEDLKFPTMLRKMWSGGEVQAWLDKQFAARRALTGGKNG